MGSFWMAVEQPGGAGRSKKVNTEIHCKKKLLLEEAINNSFLRFEGLIEVLFTSDTLYENDIHFYPPLFFFDR